MFKLVCFAVVAGAFAADTTAPVISLDFTTAWTEKNSTDKPHSAAVTSEALFADECQVGDSCVLPTPKAYDHHEGDLSANITSTIKLFVSNPPCEAPGTSCAASEVNTIQTAVNNTKRGEFVLTYQVKDQSGNDADDVTFAVIMMDKVKPTATSTFANVSWVYGGSSAFAAVTAQAKFADNYDNHVDISRVTTDDYTVCDHGTNIDTYTVCDHAGLFGKDYENNCKEFSRNIDVAYGTDYSYLSGSLLATIITGTTDFSLECQKTPFTVNLDAGNFKMSSEGCNCDGTTWNGSPRLTPANPIGLCNWGTDSATYPGAVGKFDVQPIFIIPAEDVTSGTVTLAAEKKEFSVFDTAPPVVEWIADATFSGQKSDLVGTALVDGNTATFLDRTATGENYYTHLEAGEVGGLLTNLKLIDQDVIQHSAGYTADAAQLNGASGISTARYSCIDSCWDAANLTETGSWHNAENFDCGTTNHTSGEATVNMNILEAGTFVFKYTCKDGSDRETHSCKTVYNQDHTQPILNIITADDETCTVDGVGGTCINANSTGTYDDDGALCSDLVDGDISELVEVSGDIISLAVIGTYRITYKASDTAGNAAVEMIRTVFVRDNECPTCALITDVIDQEASFPYVDADVTCSDNLPFNVEPAATSVTAERSTSQAVDVEVTGTYTITYSATDVNGNTDTLLKTPKDGTLNDRVCNNGTKTERTIIVKDSLRPTITLGYDLMEESTTGLNGWLIGAIASAVAGIALLGYSSSKASDTIVPV